MLGQFKRLISERGKESGLAVVLFVSAALVLVLPCWDWASDLEAIRISIALIATALGLDVVIQGIKELTPSHKPKIDAFYTNRNESRESWYHSLRGVKKTLILSGVTAHALLLETNEIKRIVSKKKGRVIILVPKWHGKTTLPFYEELIKAKSIKTEVEDTISKYNILLQVLKGDLEKPNEHIVLVEHDGGTAFGITMFDTENTRHGVIRLELYGFDTDNRPSLDVTRKTNQIFYEELGKSLTEWLGFNPVERGPSSEDMARLLNEKNQH